jgi:hypothetical protein
MSDEWANDHEVLIHQGRGGCKSGGCVWKAVELTSGDLPFAVDPRLRVERSVLTGRQKSAEGVVAGLPAKA